MHRPKNSIDTTVLVEYQIEWLYPKCYETQERTNTTTTLEN